MAPFKSTEYVSADGTITMGPDMPEPIDEHCSVNLDEGRSMLITGETTDYGRPLKPFFIEIQNIWAWADKLGR